MLLSLFLTWFTRESFTMSFIYNIWQGVLLFFPIVILSTTKLLSFIIFLTSAVLVCRTSVNPSCGPLMMSSILGLSTFLCSHPLTSATKATSAPSTNMPHPPKFTSSITSSYILVSLTCACGSRWSFT